MYRPEPSKAIARNRGFSSVIQRGPILVFQPPPPPPPRPPASQFQVRPDVPSWISGSLHHISFAAIFQIVISQIAITNRSMHRCYFCFHPLVHTSMTLAASVVFPSALIVGLATHTFHVFTTPAYSCAGHARVIYGTFHC